MADQKHDQWMCVDDAKTRMHAYDMIEIQSSVHNHWAVASGGDKIVHVQENILDKWIGGGSVKEESIDKVAGKGKIRVHNVMDAFVRPHPPTETVALVEHRIGPIDVRSNCEHFVTDCRYGMEPKEVLEDALQATRLYHNYEQTSREMKKNSKEDIYVQSTPW